MERSEKNQVGGIWVECERKGRDAGIVVICGERCGNRAVETSSNGEYGVSYRQLRLPVAELGCIQMSC